MENVQQPTVLPRSMALKKTAPGKILLTEYFKKEKKANQNKTNWTKDKANVKKDLGGAPSCLASPPTSFGVRSSPKGRLRGGHQLLGEQKDSNNNISS